MTHLDAIILLVEVGAIAVVAVLGSRKPPL